MTVADTVAPVARAPVPVPPAPERGARGPSGYTAALVALDALAMAIATLTAKISSLGLDAEDLPIRSFSVPYNLLVLVTVPTWLALLALAGAYDLGPFGTKRGVWKRIVRAGAQLLAVIAVAYYILHLAMLGRAVLAATVPLAVAFTLAVRAVAGAGLDALRRRGRARRTALVVGPGPGVETFVSQISSRPDSGVAVVDTVVLGDDGAQVDPLVVSDALTRNGAETLIITAGTAPGQLRDIAWALEGTGVDLLVTLAPADMDGFTAEIRPVAGLPLLHVERRPAHLA